MHSEISVVMRADVATIYRLAAGVERWPALLPHYRSVRVLEEEGERRLVAMATSRSGIPVWWHAEQRRDPTVPRITFRHVRGVTTGMEVAWTFTPVEDGVRVAIQHDLHLGWPLIGSLVAERIIGDFFIANIAGKTLRRIKQLAETGGV